MGVSLPALRLQVASRNSWQKQGNVMQWTLLGEGHLGTSRLSAQKRSPEKLQEVAWREQSDHVHSLTVFVTVLLL